MKLLKCIGLVAGCNEWIRAYFNFLRNESQHNLLGRDRVFPPRETTHNKSGATGVPISVVKTSPGSFQLGDCARTARKVS